MVVSPTSKKGSGDIARVIAILATVTICALVLAELQYVSEPQILRYADSQITNTWKIVTSTTWIILSLILTILAVRGLKR